MLDALQAALVAREGARRRVMLPLTATPKGRTAAMPRLSTTSRADSRSSMHSDESAASKEQQQQRRHSEGSSHGPRVDDDDDEREDENEEEEGEQGQGTGLLSGVRKRERATSDTRSESHDGYRVTGTTTTTMARVRNWALMTRWRTVVLALVAIALVVLLAIFFHPPSPVSSQHQQQQSPSPWYGATVKAGLKPGVFDEAHGALAPNPLESGSKFGDVPFASVGKAKVDHRPTWAGGSKLAPVTRERTVLLVSLDGVKPEHVFSSGGQMPNMLEIAQRGTSAEFLKPVFPSLTFPNHFSILTGLHPESHGIVGNGGSQTQPAVSPYRLTRSLCCHRLCGPDDGQGLLVHGPDEKLGSSLVASRADLGHGRARGRA